jgi:UDP-glucose 4-epimerase
MSLQKTVLITGAAGFIGGYAADHFSKAGWRVIAVDRNQRDSYTHPAKPHIEYSISADLSYENIIVPLQQFCPQVCIHLAGPASVGASFRDPLADFAAQTQPLLQLLESVRLSEIPTHVLLVSSAAVYGNPENLPIPEDAEVKPISPYGFHKYYQEALLDQYRALYGVSVCKARVFSTYGPGLPHLAVWDITRRALRGDYTIFGSGEETRDYLYIEDVAAALCCIAERASFAGEAINIASGRETRILDLTEKIYLELGLDATTRLLKQQGSSGNPVRWCANVSRLERLGFTRRISLEEGISRTVNWIRAECTASAW